MRRLGARALFVVVAVVALTAVKLTDYGYAPPILIAALWVLIGLVRVSWRAHDRWARDYLVWLNAAEVAKWTVWHRENVLHLAARAARVRPGGAR